MKKNTTPIPLIFIGILLISLAACSGSQNIPANNNSPATEEPVAEEPAAEEPAAEEPTPELTGDAVRGGLLYDKWWKIVGADAPETDHPLWTTQDSNTRSGGDTWRCKECHGWDYKGAEGAYSSGSHYTGFTGVFNYSGGDPNTVFSALKGETDPDHDFSMYMDDQALADLALFITQQTMDYSAIVGEDKTMLSSDIETGQTLFQETCAMCHGPAGLALNFGDEDDPEYLGDLAAGNPWEFLHKVRFGQPGAEDMPSAVTKEWTVDQQAALVAYIQTLAGQSPSTQGGLLYDKWWKVVGADAPETDHPLWATQDSNTRSGGDTWRCKECHGWDYKGAEGAYNSGSHFTGFIGVFGGEADLASWLDGSANADHDFSMYLDENAIAALVAFMQDDLVDMSIYINADKTVNGDPAAGETLFLSGCAQCHGEDGKLMNFGDEDNPEFLGDLAADNPWEVLHKAANGQPGSEMPAGLSLGWTWQDLADVVAFLQTLAGE